MFEKNQPSEVVPTEATDAQVILNQEQATAAEVAVNDQKLKELKEEVEAFNKGGDLLVGFLQSQRIG